ncbi:MAG: DAK2 domain-containing protein [Actinomycetota bacterium]
MSISQTSKSDDKSHIGASGVYGITAGWLSALDEHRDEINALNVFPVPDGDTGTNMYLTLQTVMAEVNAAPDKTVAGYAKSIKDGSLKGARGNSGVILSQILRGACDVIADQPEVSAKILAKALTRGSDTAYEAVMKPVEGTMLTVVKDMAREARRMARKTESIREVLESVLAEGKASLERTPDLLPTLKEAGVVDAGGKGLVIMAESTLATLTGDRVWLEPPVDYVKTPAAAAFEEEEIDLEYTYCTEFVVKSEDFNLNEFRAELDGLGGSLLVVGENGITKTHIHTNQPGRVLTAAAVRGELTGLKIDNMREQSEAKAAGREDESPVKQKPLGVVAVASGEGIKKILRSLGVEAVVDGGQTMNPSTEDLVRAVEQLRADSVIILPNNKNIILTARQAEKLTDKRVFVIPTKAVTEAFAGLLQYDENRDPETVAAAMTGAAAAVKTAEITWASRDSNANKQKIKKGDIIGIASGDLVAGGRTIGETALKLLKALIDKDSEIVSLIRGENFDEEAAAAVAAKIEKDYPDVEVHVYEGGQPLYPLIMGVE